jgi:hypothetical protein
MPDAAEQALRTAGTTARSERILSFVSTAWRNRPFSKTAQRARRAIVRPRLLPLRSMRPTMPSRSIKPLRPSTGPEPLRLQRGPAEFVVGRLLSPSERPLRIDVPTLEHFSALMAAEGWSAHVSALAFDRIYARERFILARRRGSPELAALALSLLFRHRYGHAGLPAA